MTAASARREGAGERSEDAVIVRWAGAIEAALEMRPLS